MAGNIRGITIEIGGNTQRLTQALQAVNRESRDLQGELKQIDRLLELDPSNVELLSQRQQVLAEAVEESRQKMRILRDAEEQLNSQFANGTITTDEYTEQHRALQREIIQTGQRLENLEEQSSRCNAELEAFAARADMAGQKMTAAGKALAPASAAITGLGVAAVKVTADFDESMSQVAATMGLTTEEIKAGSKEYDIMRKAAKDAGESTKYSASEAAEALNYLALAGYDAQKASDALVPILNLAAAGNMELAQASDMVTDSMSALGIEATTDNLVKFGDQLVKASQKSNTSVAQLGDAILTVGGTAKQLAGGTNEMATALGILADNGIKASEGGTALRNIILSLTPSTDPAIKAFEQLGVTAYDANGNMRPINETFKDLNVAMSQLTNEEKQDFLIKMFNKTDLAAISALMANTASNMDELTGALEIAGVTFEETGINMQIMRSRFDANDSIEGFINDMTKAGLTVEQATVAYNGLESVLNENGNRFDQLSDMIADCDSAMQQAADTQLENLNGQLTIVASQLQGLAITIGEALMPIVMKVVEAIQNFLTVLANIDPRLQSAIIIIGAVVAALGPLLLLFGKLAGSVTAIIGIMPMVTKGLEGIGGAMKLLAANPIVLVIAAIAALIAIFATLWQTNEEFRDNFISLWESIKSFATKTLNHIKELFKNIFDGIYTIFQSFAKLMRGDFSGFLEGILSLANQAVPNMLNAGRNLFTGMWDGMKQIWNDLKGWVSDTVDWLADKLTFWRNSQAEMDSADGSHAQGLNYVPRDGYRAILHEGEAVLTKAEARDYRQGNSGKGTAQINVTQHIYSPTPDARSEQRQAAREFKRLAVQMG